MIRIVIHYDYLANLVHWLMTTKSHCCKIRTVELRIRSCRGPTDHLSKTASSRRGDGVGTTVTVDSGDAAVKLVASNASSYVAGASITAEGRDLLTGIGGAGGDDEGLVSANTGGAGVVVDVAGVVHVLAVLVTVEGDDDGVGAHHEGGGSGEEGGVRNHFDWICLGLGG